MPNEPINKTPTPTVPPKDAPKPAPGVTSAPAPAVPKAPAPPDKAADGKTPTAPDGKAQPQAGAVKPDPAARTPEAGKTTPDKAADPKAPVAPDGKAQPQAGAAKPDTPAKNDKAQGEKKPAEPDKPNEGKAPAQPDEAADGKAPVVPDGKAQPQTGAAKPDTPAKDDKAQGEKKPTEPDKAADGKAPAAPDGKAQPQTEPAKPDPAAKTPEAKKDADGKDAAKDDKTQGEKKPAEAKAPAQPEAPSGPAAMGPAGTAITQVLEDRLNPPSEKDKKDLPHPGKGETFSVKLHPGYLKPSKFNTFSVDRNSDDYKELRKSIELLGVKEPVLARPGKDGELEIISGQRRHVVAAELNYPVPTIIAAIDDDDAKILVADSNIHREKITSFDLSRALRMKMDAMKHKAGRRRKGETGPDLNSDEMLAKEMGMTVAKLNRIIRLSEASKEVCERVDDGYLSVSLASAISFLQPANQDELLYLMDIGFKPTTAQIERMKKVDKTGKLTGKSMREILDDKDIAPKVVPTPPAPTPTPTAPVTPSQAVPSASAQPTPKEPLPPNPTSAMGPAAATVPASPDVPAADKGEDDPFKGKQERPENLKIILTGDRLRKYFPDVEMTPREVEESIYGALEERRQRQIRQQKKDEIFKGPHKAPSR